MKLSKKNIEYLETFEKMLNSQPPFETVYLPDHYLQE